MTAHKLREKQNWLYKILAVLLVAATFLLLINTSTNWHFHKSDSGYLIVHAHPYHKAENKGDLANNGHHHTASALVFFQLVIEILFLVFITILALLSIILSFQKRINISPERIFSVFLFPHISLRGPPSIY